MPNLTGLLAGLSGLPEGYQKQQQQQQEQLYRQFLMQQYQQQAAQQAQQFQQQQQGLGAAWGASGRLGGGGMGGGGPPDTMMQPQQPQQQPLPQAPRYGPSGGMPTDAQLGLARQAIARGYPPAAAAGMAGSMTGESGANLDPYALNPTSGALGEAQWMGPRKAALMQQPNPYSRDTQNNFLFSELRGPEASTGQRLMGATDPGQAAKDFTTGFERPGKVDMSGRVQAAQAVFAQIAPEAKQVSTQVAQAVPPQQWGRSSVEDLHRAIEQSNPDASPQVKMIALMQLQKLMAPTEKAELQMWAMQNRAELQTAMQETVAQFKQGLKPDQGEKGWQFIQTPEGKTVRANPNTGETAEVNLPAGASKMGSGRSQAETPEIQFPDKWEGMPDKPPPGVRPDIWSAALTYVQTGQMPSLGFQPGVVRNQIVATTPAAQHALGITPSGEAEQMAKFAGQKHGEIVLGGRVANLETSINEAEKAAPVVIQTSQKVPRTDLGPFINRWITGAQLQSGDPNIVAFQGALNSFLNMYARGINPTGRLTDQQQRHAYEVLNTAMAQGQIESGVKQLQYELQLMKSGLGEAAQETPKMFRPPATAPQQETPQPPGGGAPHIDNQADYDKLPPGADYIGPDGQPYKKKQ